MTLLHQDGLGDEISLLHPYYTIRFIAKNNEIITLRSLKLQDSVLSSELTQQISNQGRCSPVKILIFYFTNKC